MDHAIVIVLGLLFFMFMALTLNLAGADFILFITLACLIFTGVLTPRDALAGFSNEGLITVAFLFIVSAALKASGNLDLLATRYLGTSRRGGIPRLLIKMMPPIATLSAFINNTPIVVIFTPVIKNWAEKIRLPASKFLIPLSYATVLGGTCTLIGTSTNLLAHSLMLDNRMGGFSLFELAWVGIPCTLAGMGYLAFASGPLLPDRMDVQTAVEKNPKEYVVEMKVPRGSVLAGRTIVEAGLRNLRNIYLLEIEREGASIGLVSGKTQLEEEDRLVFVGVPSSVMMIQEIPGLVPAAHGMFEHDFAKIRTHFVEVVLSPLSPVIGQTVKECDFRARYGAGVVAVHRNGERIKDKVGNISLKSGDTLLLYTDQNFVKQWRDSRDFFLVSSLGNRPPAASRRTVLTLVITAAMVLLAAAGESLPVLGLPEISIFHTSMAAVILLLFLRCLEGRELQNALRWDILFVIAFSIGISKALQTSGAANLLASYILEKAPSLGPTALLAILYFATVLTTEMLTNNAAVAIVFPLAVATASKLGLDPKPFIVAVTVAASYGFASPFGYQTHLIVQGPGGYRFGDYVRIGLPLDILVGIVAITAIRLHWPLS